MKRDRPPKRLIIRDLIRYPNVGEWCASADTLGVSIKGHAGGDERRISIGILWTELDALRADAERRFREKMPARRRNVVAGESSGKATRRNSDGRQK